MDLTHKDKQLFLSEIENFHCCEHNDAVDAIISKNVAYLLQCKSMPRIPRKDNKLYDSGIRNVGVSRNSQLAHLQMLTILFAAPSHITLLSQHNPLNALELK